MEFFIGILTGVVLSICVSFGAAFFSMLQTCVHYGFKRSVPFVFGVNFTDVTIVTLCLTLLSGYDMNAILHNVWVASLGGAVLVGLGIHSFTRRAKSAENMGKVMEFRDAEGPKWYSVYFRGLIINLFNPMMWLYWISVIAIFNGKFDITSSRLPLAFAGTLTTTLSLDVLKCKLSSQLQRFFDARTINIFNKAIGIVLWGFAIYLVATMIKYQIVVAH